MNCHDAREGFSAAFHGGMGLTEWALLDAHVRQCVECRKERESVQKVVNSRQQVTPSRVLLHCLSKMIDALSLGTTRLAAWLTRLGLPLSISLTVAGLAVIGARRVAATWLVDLLTRARWLLPKLFKLFVWAAATVIEAPRFASVRFAGLLARLWVSLEISLAESGQAAVRMIRASRVGVTWLVGLLARMRGVLPLLCTLSERAAVKAIGATWVVGRIVVTTSGRALSLPGLSTRIPTPRRRYWTTITSERMLGSARTSPLWHTVASAWSSTRSREPLMSRGMTSGTRSFLRVSTEIASLAILVATIVFLWPAFLWPRGWPHNSMPRPSTGEQLSPDVRPRADRKPVELASAAQLAATQTPKPVSAYQPVPAAVSQPDTRRVTVRRRPREPQAEIPAPLRRPDPALAHSRAAASAPTPTPETIGSPEPSRRQESARSQDGASSQNAEVSDPASDWLLKGGRGTSRQSIESP
jgi:hypothetical protein